MRNACYTCVSLDTAPAPELTIISETAAGLTGIPLKKLRAGSRKEQGNDALLHEVGLGLTGSNLDVFEGVRPSPYSSNYGGHQFGNWAGQLGDGRVCTLGEIQTAEGVAGMCHGSLLEVSTVLLSNFRDRPFRYRVCTHLRVSTITFSRGFIDTHKQGLCNGTTP